jgi:hypothetical protein
LVPSWILAWGGTVVAIDFNNQLQKKDADFGTEIKVHRTTYTRSSQSGGGSPGDTVPGGGIVTDVTPTTTTVQFPDGAVPEHVNMPGSETTAMYEFGPATPTDSGAGVYVNGQGPTVGQHLPDGGVVTEVGTDTVTIAYPDGVPQGPIQVPWVETTVVQESAPVTDDDIHPGATFPAVDTLSLSDLGAEDVPLGTAHPQTHLMKVVLPHAKPDGTPRPLKLEPQDLPKFTNAGSSPCPVYVLYLDGSSTQLSFTKVMPGKTINITTPSNAARLLIFADVACHKAGTIVVSWQVS